MRKMEARGIGALVAWDAVEQSGDDATPGSDLDRAIAAARNRQGKLNEKNAAGKYRSLLSALARLIAPFTPHLAEECWARMGEAGMVLDAPWPAYDPALAADDELVLPIQIAGKRRSEITMPRGADTASVEAAALANPAIQVYLSANNFAVKKVIVVPDRIVNLVVG